MGLIGTSLLLAMAVGSFATVYGTVLTVDAPDPLFVTIVGSRVGNDLIFTHSRGETLRDISLAAGGVDYNYSRWVIGEQLSIFAPSPCWVFINTRGVCVFWAYM